MRMTASAPSKVALALDRLGLEALMQRRRDPPTLPRLLLVTGMSGAGKSTRARRARGHGLGLRRQSAVSLLDELRSRRRASECRLVPLAVGMDVAQPRLRRRRPCPRSIRSIQGVTPRNPLSRLRGQRAAPPLRRDPAPPPACARPPGRGRHRARTRHDRAAAQRRRQHASTRPT